MKNKKLLQLIFILVSLFSTSLLMSASANAGRVIVYVPNNFMPSQGQVNINATVTMKALPSGSYNSFNNNSAIVSQEGNFSSPVVVGPGTVYYPANTYGSGNVYYNNYGGGYDSYGHYVPQSNTQAVGYGLGSYFGWK